MTTRQSRGDNADLNLTPLLDLFSTLVCFLLLTAAWFQVESLSTNVEYKNNAVANLEIPKVQLVVTLLKDEIQMSENEHVNRLPAVINEQGQLNVEQMRYILQVWRSKYPDRKDVILNTENQIPYKHMITAFDTLVGEGWPDVGVNTQ